jgi:hypothetical protein
LPHGSQLRYQRTPSGWVALATAEVWLNASVRRSPRGQKSQGHGPGDTSHPSNVTVRRVVNWAKKNALAMSGLVLLSVTIAIFPWSRPIDEVPVARTTLASVPDGSGVSVKSYCNTPAHAGCRLVANIFAPTDAKPSSDTEFSAMLSAAFQVEGCVGSCDIERASGLTIVHAKFDWAKSSDTSNSLGLTGTAEIRLKGSAYPFMSTDGAHLHGATPSVAVLGQYQPPTVLIGASVPDGYLLTSALATPVWPTLSSWNQVTWQFTKDEAASGRYFDGINPAGEQLWNIRIFLAGILGGLAVSALFNSLERWISSSNHEARPGTRHD